MKKQQIKVISMGMIVVAIVAIILNWQRIADSVKVEAVNQEEAKKVLDKSFDTSTPEGEMLDYEEMGEQQLIDEIHGMTHQKVQANQKWGSSEITKDKVLILYEVVKHKSFSNDDVGSMLLGILKPWTQGDFSNAVNDHNAIWNYLNGTVGEALRLSTPSEELKYIENNFR